MRKDKTHLDFVRELPCTVCGRPAPSEAAHCRLRHFGNVRVPNEEQGGTGLKPHDKWVLSLCHACHRKQHAVGERNFWLAYSLNPLEIAQELYGHSGDTAAALWVIRRVKV